MIEDVIELLDQLGVDDEERDRTEHDKYHRCRKDGVVEIISALLTNGLEFDISATTSQSL